MDHYNAPDGREVDTLEWRRWEERYDRIGDLLDVIEDALDESDPEEDRE